MQSVESCHLPDDRSLVPLRMMIQCKLYPVTVAPTFDPFEILFDCLKSRECRGRLDLYEISGLSIGSFRPRGGPSKNWVDDQIDHMRGMSASASDLQSRACVCWEDFRGSDRS